MLAVFVSEYRIISYLFKRGPVIDWPSFGILFTGIAPFGASVRTQLNLR